MGMVKKRPMNDAGRPTTLSMIKSGMGVPQRRGTDNGCEASCVHPPYTDLERRMQNKIALMEAKLRQMEAEDPNAVAPPPLHPSLPAKPPASSRSLITSAQSAPRAHPKRTPLPSLPIQPQSALKQLSQSIFPKQGLSSGKEGLDVKATRSK